MASSWLYGEGEVAIVLGLSKHRGVGLPQVALREVHLRGMGCKGCAAVSCNCDLHSLAGSIEEMVFLRVVLSGSPDRLGRVLQPDGAAAK